MFDDPLSFETAAKTTTRVMLDNFTQLETMSSDLDDFKIEIATFFSAKRAQRLTEALSGTYETLNNTDDSITASDFALDTINNINEIYDIEKLEDLGVAGSSRKMEFITDSGLEAIDKDSDGIFTTQLFGIEAQPGTGKTRFTLGTYCYRDRKSVV